MKRSAMNVLAVLASVCAALALSGCVSGSDAATGRSIKQGASGQETANDAQAATTLIINGEDGVPLSVYTSSAPSALATAEFNEQGMNVQQHGPSVNAAVDLGGAGRLFAHAGGDLNIDGGVEVTEEFEPAGEVVRRTIKVGSIKSGITDPTREQVAEAYRALEAVSLGWSADTREAVLATLQAQVAVGGEVGDAFGSILDVVEAAAFPPAALAP